MTTPIPKPVCGGQTQVLVDATSELIDLNWSAANVVELRTIEPVIDGQKLDLDGHTENGIGGGPFFYDASDSGSDNNGERIVTAGGKSWIRGNVQSVTPQMFGWLSSITDHTDILINTHSAGKPVWYGEYDYIVKRPNEILLIDGIGYCGKNATITVPSDAVIVDTVGASGRFENSAFYRNSTSPLLKTIAVTGFDFKIEQYKWNGVGGGTVAARDDAEAAYWVYNNTIENNGTPSGEGGPAVAGFFSGALIQLSGYPLVAYNNIGKDCGHGIVSLSGLYCRVYDNDFEYCGVSRDHTSWSNVPAYLLRGNKDIYFDSNKSNFTGGTSLFVSAGGSLEVKNVHVKNNILLACGLTAIAAGHRTTSTGPLVTDSIVIEDNDIQGFTCAPGATLHGGVGVSTLNGSSKISLIRTRNNISYLAPYETFNYSTNEIDGSHNANKSVGGVSDVGSQYGLKVQADTVEGITESYNNDTISNHQRGGFLLTNIKKCRGDITTYNCGWSRDGSNNAFQVQQGGNVEDITSLNLKHNNDEQSRGVNSNDSFCTPLIAKNIQGHTLELIATNSNNQDRALRLINDVAAYKLNIIKFDFDNAEISGGYSNVVDDSSGSNTTKTVIKWKNANNIAPATGSRTLPLGHKSVAAKYSMGFGLITTLEAAAYYDESEIEFSANAGQTHTVTPDGTDEIDGSNSSLVIPAGQSVKLVSIGGEWLSTRTMH